MTMSRAADGSHSGLTAGRPQSRARDVAAQPLGPANRALSSSLPHHPRPSGMDSRADALLSSHHAALPPGAWSPPLADHPQTLIPSLAVVGPSRRQDESSASLARLGRRSRGDRLAESVAAERRGPMAAGIYLSGKPETGPEAGVGDRAESSASAAAPPRLGDVLTASLSSMQPKEWAARSRTASSAVQVCCRYSVKHGWVGVARGLSGVIRHHAVMLVHLC